MQRIVILHTKELERRMIQCQYEIHISKNDTYSMTRPHFHEDVEIALCVEGEGIFFLGSDIFPLSRGQLFLIDSTVLHRSVANEEYRCIVFHISRAILRELSSPQSNFIARSGKSGLIASLKSEETAELERLFYRLMEDFGEEFGADIRRTALVLSFLASCFSYSDRAENQRALENHSLVRVMPVLDYIQEHLSENLTTQSIADNFYMNKYHLCHLFKEGTGFSMMDYVINCRILKARSLLREGMPVQEAGEQAGFRSNEHFIRTFKKLTGLPPKKYAMKYKESDLKMKQEIVVVEARDGRRIESLKV